MTCTERSLYQMSKMSTVTADDIFALARARALDGFNQNCAARKLGHWPSDRNTLSIQTSYKNHF